MAVPLSSTSATHHRLAVRGRIGVLQLNFKASFAAPWTVLFGPSGCGKSTLLRALSGLSPELHVDFGRGTGEGQWRELSPSIPTERRQLAYAPQQAALFPHLNVLENLRFAQTVAKRGKTAGDVAELLALFQLEPLTRRLPRQLSGGERQRVSLARAFAVPDARLMLLDEPFAGLDRSLRDLLLPRMRAWLTAHRLPVLSVTHDVDETLLLEAEVIRLEGGRNAAQGPARGILTGEIARLLQALGKL